MGASGFSLKLLSLTLPFPGRPPPSLVCHPRPLTGSRPSGHSLPLPVTPDRFLSPWLHGHSHLHSQIPPPPPPHHPHTPDPAPSPGRPHSSAPTPCLPHTPFKDMQRLRVFCQSRRSLRPISPLPSPQLLPNRTLCRLEGGGVGLSSKEEGPRRWRR